MGNCLKPQRAATWADGDEWEEEAEVCSSKAAAAAVEEKRVEVKIRVTRRQLQELLEKAGCGGKAKRRQVEEVLAELMASGRVCYQQEMRRHWRPALYSIPEAAVEES
ncbi:uncharacterized protein [Miscanthus floridulus]|uniref:uncharacterized protein n=1 Tax=Miscanthus floridulus TaxID=154761 RepID=UPI0034592663